MRRLLLLILCLWPCVSLLASPPTDILSALPKNIAGCEKAKIHEYQPEGLGASLPFEKERMHITVYVYDLDAKDITDGLDHEVVKKAFRTAEKDVQTATQNGSYSDLEELDSGVAKFGPGRQTLRSRFRLTRVKAGGERAVTEVHVFGAAGHIIKLRATAGVDLEAELTKTVEKFVPALMDALHKLQKK
jgi:hypothetical protein